MRVRAILGAGWGEVPATVSADWLRPIGIKAFADGALGSRGAQLREPYRDRPTRGIAVWAVLKEIGAEGMRERVRRHNDFARMVAERARAEAELELLSEPQLSICCFRYRPLGWDDPERIDALNEDILAELRRVGRSLPSSTNVDGAYAIRACFINPRNDREHMEMP